MYSIIGIIQGMGFNYLSSVLSTIEKQFGIKSEETAWVFSGNEIRSQNYLIIIDKVEVESKNNDIEIFLSTLSM